MTLYVGIDVAKFFHVVAVVDEEGLVLDTLRVDNDAAGYARLRQGLSQYGSAQLLVALESTGHYGHALRDWLLDQGFEVHIFNPLKTNRFRDFYVQWRKNDERDAMALAHLLRLGERQLYHPLPLNVRSLKQMVRHRALLVQARARTKNQIRAILDEVFPEYQQQALFSDPFGTTSLALLSRYPTPAHLAALDEAQLYALLHQHSQGHLGIHQAQRIQQAACHSVGSPEAGCAYTPILPAFIAGFQSLSVQIDQCTAHLESYLAETNQTLTTIPGMGPVLAATILAEIGDVHRFPSADHLVAYCGLALGEDQSGQARARRFLSRRGSARLRTSFYQAALVAVKYDPCLKAYHQRRLSQGLAAKKSLLSVARKLVRISYALLKSGQSYQTPPAASPDPEHT